jgi:hypothetical protein
MRSTLPELTDRPTLKLYAAKIHLEASRYLHNTKRILVSQKLSFLQKLKLTNFLSTSQCKRSIASGDEQKIHLGIPLNEVDRGKSTLDLNMSLDDI